MTEKEWLDIGYDKNIIDVQAYEEITFMMYTSNGF